MSRKLSLILSTILSFHALACATPARALATSTDPDAPRIVGTWKLKDFVMRSAQGKEETFCPGMNGLLTYEKSGFVSVAINCAPKAPGAPAIPADAYGNQIFYAGSFEIHGDEVVHKLTQSNVPSLVGQSLIRKVAALTDRELVLTGKLGTKGDTLRISWENAASSKTTGTDQAFSLFTFITVKPGMEQKFIEEVSTIVDASRSEPGNIAWYVQQSKENPSEFIFFTRWIDEEALQWHLASAPLASYIERTREMQAQGSPKLVRFTPIDRSPTQ